MELSKRHAMISLASMGFDVEEIATVVREKRADLRAAWQWEEYIVEAKMRGERNDWHEFVTQARRDGFASISRLVDPWSAISSKIREASQQLEATPASPGALRLFWVPALHDDDTFVLDCVEKRLFGLERVTVVRSMSIHERPTVKRCYYHGHADFRRYRGIDAAVLFNRKGGWLCVNSFSARLAQVRNSRLYKMFGEKGAVRDPEVLEKGGDAFFLGEDYVPGGDNTGREGRAAWAYIRRKYGVLTSKMVESNFNTLFSVSAGEGL